MRSMQLGATTMPPDGLVDKHAGTSLVSSSSAVNVHVTGVGNPLPGYPGNC